MTRFRQTILVVDDDAFIRRPLEFILRQEGFDPITADGGPACMQRLAEARPDLIIMDVMMPGTDGFELCKTIKREARYASIPIILLSARNRELDRERGLSLGATDFLAKPYSPAELLSRVREVLSLSSTEEETTP
jgi:DNA-binding response OmpR family regulator